MQELREAPDTTKGGIVRGDIDQWFRPGGQAGRQRDLEGLGPLGQPSATKDGGSIYQLPNGRQAVLRFDSAEGLTLEVQIPSSAGRFTRTDKFRYH